MKRKGLGLMVLMGILMVFGLGACATTQDRLSAVEKAVPLPSDLKIVLPDASIPEEFARFSGKWHGLWDEKMGHILVVERIVTPEEVHVIYAYEKFPEYRAYTANWHRVIGKFKNGELYLELREGEIAIYKYKNGRLIASYRKGPYHSVATLTKQTPL